MWTRPYEAAVGIRQTLAQLAPFPVILSVSRNVIVPQGIIATLGEVVNTTSRAWRIAKVDEATTLGTPAPVILCRPHMIGLWLPLLVWMIERELSQGTASGDDNNGRIAVLTP